MGLNSFTKTPCGFAFAEYYTTDHAAACLNNVSGTICDDRQIRCDMDAGFKPGRQFGRGQSGGQTRDERRKENDVARGGLKARTPPLPPRSQHNKRDRNDRDGNINHDRRGGSDMRDRKISDKFGRDNERVERKIIIVPDQYKKIDPLVDGLRANRPAPRVHTPYVPPPSFTAVDSTPTAAELIAAEEIEEEERQSKKGRY
jgi:RNA recognition motif-containing protein